MARGKDSVMEVTSEALQRGSRRNRLERILGVFADVRPAEARSALLLAANIFCLLASYYLLKTARESLILSEASAEVKSYAAAAQALILLAAVPLYGKVASCVGRTHLINGVLLFFIGHLVLFQMLASRGIHIGVAFFLWVGVFNLMVVAQFWAFANDVYTIERGQRLFPIVGVGGSLGAWFGARAASKLITAAHVQPPDLLLLAAAGLLVCVGLNYCVIRQSLPSQQRPVEGKERPLGREGGLRLIVTDPYLRLIAALAILVNVVNTTGEYLLGRLVVADALRALADGTAGGFTKSQLIGIFYGELFAWVNLGSLAIQLLLVSRVFKRIGVGGALFVLPLIACGSYGLLAFLPFLGAVRIGKILENSTDYSLQNTARHALFLPTSREAKFKAKQAIDGLCWRLGDVVQAGIVLVGVRLAFGVREFALLNEVFVALWIAVVVAIYRHHHRLTWVRDARPQAA
jgi:AAA family ATP:ADP antiporter